jgi:hypothetical protein
MGVMPSVAATSSIAGTLSQPLIFFLGNVQGTEDGTFGAAFRVFLGQRQHFCKGSWRSI